MTEQEKILFNRLKQEVSKTFLQENSALSPDISKWKGDDIVRFQEDLLHKVKGRVSEKWFYNYFRNEIQKLPRIDMLNLLSQYAGYQNWADFKQKHQAVNQKKQNRKKQIHLNKYYLYGVFVLLITGIVAFSLTGKSQNHIRFCFTDENGQSIDKVKVTWLMPGESEKNLPLQQNCVLFMSNLPEVQLRIESPYYKDVIISRKLQTGDYNEQIILQTDVIALLLQHFSASETRNWEKRKQQLDKLIADEALIYQQWQGTQKGIELYEKEDFIAQLCVPNGIIKHMKILEIAYKNNKISKLRFIINQKNETD